MAEIIEMPKLSDTMTTGTLVRWLKKEGASVAAGEMIAEVETDKATMEVECFEDGHILKHYASEGQSVVVGDPICAVGEKGEDAPEVKSSEKPAKEESDDKEEKKDSPSDSAKDEKKESQTDKDKSKGKSGEKAAAEQQPKEETDSADDDSGDRIKVSPLARRIAKENGIDLKPLKGTGPNGRIVKEDVLNAPKSPDSKPADKSSATAAVNPLEDQEIKVTNMRIAIAKALVASKTEAPHFYLQMEVDGAPIAALRKSLNDRLAELPPEQGGIKFTINDLILKAAAEAVRRVPAINRSWKGDKIVQYGNVHLAFGVAVDDGLLTPVIREAESKSLRQISAEARDLIGKARNRKLKPDEMSGSTLTVTNLGMFGISDFYGIINPPNAAILSVGATVKTPVVNEKNEIVIGQRMKIGLSGDHRVIDGAVGAQYLAALREIVETPALMLV
jgi:pyruvate dehydrogenase E2 component (dihydrolipoamide acetyltransferase)